MKWNNSIYDNLFKMCVIRLIKQCFDYYRICRKYSIIIVKNHNEYKIIQ